MEINDLPALHRIRVLTPLDIAFADLLLRIDPTADADVLMAAALCSNATGNKHICLGLEETAGRILAENPDRAGEIRCPSLSEWRSKLKDSPLVGCPGEKRPLVLDSKNRLYLFRYWQYETRLAEDICNRMDAPLLPVDLDKLWESLARYFNGAQETGSPKYLHAALAACFKPICIITGGPGTGKTTTVAKILALLIEQDAELRILLAAPTGKAAARLGESMQACLAHLHCSEDIRSAVTVRPRTIHRMLGTDVRLGASFVHGYENPLPADIVVIDEASMVDTALMSKLVSAVPQKARLILLGDKHQLSSVESGSAFGDICMGLDSAVNSTYWDSVLARNPFESPLSDVAAKNAEYTRADSIVSLDVSFRFDPGQGIGRLTKAVEQGDAATVSQMMGDDAGFSDVRFEKMNSRKAVNEILERNIIAGYTEYLTEKDDGTSLDKLKAFRVLCPLKKGWTGTGNINRFAESVLDRRGLIDPVSEWYEGRPIIVTENDYRLGLFNGDTGIIVTDDNGTLFACFQTEQGGIRYVAPYRLPPHETAFAMTVHKSQGSEFGSVLLLLPDSDCPILTRELLYTGISRARQTVTVCCNEKIFHAALRKTVHRQSGLADGIWR